MTENPPNWESQPWRITWHSSLLLPYVLSAHCSIERQYICHHPNDCPLFCFSYSTYLSLYIFQLWLTTLHCSIMYVQGYDRNVKTVVTYIKTYIYIYIHVVDKCVQRKAIVAHVSDDAWGGRVIGSPSHVFRGAGQCQLKDWPSVTQFCAARLLWCACNIA